LKKTSFLLAVVIVMVTSIVSVLASEKDKTGKTAGRYVAVAFVKSKTLDEVTQLSNALHKKGIASLYDGMRGWFLLVGKADKERAVNILSVLVKGHNRYNNVKVLH